jgi:hypothetical protein
MHLAGEHPNWDNIKLGCCLGDVLRAMFTPFSDKDKVREAFESGPLLGLMVKTLEQVRKQSEKRQDRKERAGKPGPRRPRVLHLP